MGGGIKCGSRLVFSLIHGSREYSVLAVFVLSPYIYCVVVVRSKPAIFNRGLWFSFFAVDRFSLLCQCFFLCFVFVAG